MKPMLAQRATKADNESPPALLKPIEKVSVEKSQTAKGSVCGRRRRTSELKASECWFCRCGKKYKKTSSHSIERHKLMCKTWSLSCGKPSSENLSSVVEKKLRDAAQSNEPPNFNAIFSRVMSWPNFGHFIADPFKNTLHADSTVQAILLLARGTVRWNEAFHSAKDPRLPFEELMKAFSRRTAATIPFQRQDGRWILLSAICTSPANSASISRSYILGYAQDMTIPLNISSLVKSSRSFDKTKTLESSLSSSLNVSPMSFRNSSSNHFPNMPKNRTRSPLRSKRGRDPTFVIQPASGLQLSRGHLGTSLHYATSSAMKLGSTGHKYVHQSTFERINGHSNVNAHQIWLRPQLSLHSSLGRQTSRSLRLHNENHAAHKRVKVSTPSNVKLQSPGFDVVPASATCMVTSNEHLGGPLKIEGNCTKPIGR
mmetsp:Transcript_8638/g.16738  ORF Transcript_8638/g.16738 Transcript_8638/m.16738 type:complete len:428 (+) Transcript_8638:151-1434(+)